MNLTVEHFINAKDYLLLRSELGWKTIREEQVERALKNSMINI